jgi:molybdopterin/thiamine biosynthesis adenylyltransferase
MAIRPRAPLTAEEKGIYAWQLTIPGFGEAQQEKLKAASVLVTRVGGVGGTAALYLAAAGVGRLVLAHHGKLRASDLNRQILMSAEGLGKKRIELASKRLRDLNPRLELLTVPENAGPDNVERLVKEADLVVDAAPLFRERFALNREIVRTRTPMVDAAMYELEGQLTTILPGKSPCLACLYPDEPPAWRREFPVLGAVAGTMGALAALEAVKVLAGVGEPLAGRLLHADLRSMAFRTVHFKRDAHCRVCAGA